MVRTQPRYVVRAVPGELPGQLKWKHLFKIKYQPNDVGCTGLASTKGKVHRIAKEPLTVPESAVYQVYESIQSSYETIASLSVKQRGAQEESIPSIL